MSDRKAGSGTSGYPADALPSRTSAVASALRRLGESRRAMVSGAILLVVVPWTFDAWTVLRQGFRALRHPFPTCLTELSILDGARAFAQGAPLFPPVGDLPFSLHVYNVLNYLPAGLAGRMAGLSIDELMVASRVLPYLSALGLLVLVVWYVRLMGGDAWTAVLGVTMVLFFHTSTLPDFFRNRPETPGLFFTTLGFLLCLAHPRGWTVLAALAFTAAFGFKQTFLAAPAAAVVYLLVQRRNPTRLIVTSLATVALFTAACRLAFGPGYFQHTYLAMADNPYDFVRGLGFLPILLRDHWGLLVVSVAAAAVVVRRNAVFAWLVLCLAWTIAIEGKFGADVNYHAELSFVMVLAVVTAVVQLRERTWAVAVLAPVVLGTWIGIARGGLGWNEVCFNRIAPTPRCYVETPPFATRTDYVERYRGRTDALILDPEIGVRAGVPAVNDVILVDLLFRSGFLRFERLEEEIRSRRPEIVVFHRESFAYADWLGTLFNEALGAGYLLAFSDGNLVELHRGAAGRNR